MTDAHLEPRSASGHSDAAATDRERDDLAIPIRSAADIIVARQQGRDLALAIGFSDTESALIATAISELSRNIVVYAGAGEIRVEAVRDSGHDGVVVTADDEGPGIRNLQRVLTGGYSTSGGLGLGVSGVRRMMDEFSVDSEIGGGTLIIAKKWLR